MEATLCKALLLLLDEIAWLAVAVIGHRAAQSLRYRFYAYAYA